jgi:L-serine/L-threonine ammonia-lyase
MESISIVTPLWESQPLSQAHGAPILLKMEALQPSGSFKARGMEAACRASLGDGATRVICASGGNAGYAVAHAGRRLGLEVTIVVPKTTSSRAKELISSEGANLVVHGDSWDRAHAHATQLARSGKRFLIHPFDDPRVWAGNSRIIHEIAEKGVKPDAIVASVGGGGLLCGLVEGLRATGWTDVPILAVETEGAASFAASFQAGRLVTLDKINSIATSLGALTVARQALDYARQHPITPWLVTDRQAVDACLRFADEHRVLVEPACGATLAAVYGGAAPLEGKRLVVIIVCGGVGVNRALLEKWDREVPK